MRSRWRSPAGLTILSFAALVGIGAIALWLPFATRTPLSLVDALFLATSAVCVTGLSPVDSGQVLSPFGQAILLVLIQVGGLGYMSIAAFAALTLRHRLSVGQRAALSMLLSDRLDASSLVCHAIGFTLLTETLGTIALFVAFQRYDLPWGICLWFALFHSVSAFCNAGLDVFGLVGAERGWGSSLQPFAHDPWVLIPIAMLLITGGIGFPVVAEVAVRFRQRRFRWSVHLRVVLLTNCVLWLGGAVSLWLLERGNPETLGQQSLGEQVLSAFFHAATARTAGFASVPIGAMTAASLWLLCLLMFIGASPGGTGGGIKTTTAALLASAAWAGVLGYDQVVLLRRSVPAPVLARAMSLTLLAAHTVGIATLLLCLTERHILQNASPTTHAFLSLLFEVVSAFGTVGLSTGITPSLTPWGKLILVVTMFVGRIGLLTVLVALVGRPIRTAHYAREEVFIG